jgi:hypothetical protein
MKKVVLYLTSPSSISRSNLSLKNFKQLQKLGYDIITLSTTDFLPDFIVENSKVVLYRYKNEQCNKKYYYNYYKDCKRGYYVWSLGSNHTVVFFHNTHFPALLKNTKDLICLAESFGYDDYLFIEDDHFLHDDDLNKIHDLFNKLNESDLIPFYFHSGTPVYCSYLHFGKTKKMADIFLKVPEKIKDFENDSFYLNFYEHVFRHLVYKFKSDDLKINEITEKITDVFPKSTFNLVYSFLNLDDDTRCNFIWNDVTKKNAFYYHAVGIPTDTKLDFYLDDEFQYSMIIKPGCWYLNESTLDSEIKKTKVIINDKIVKSFDNLNVDQIIHNGILFN